MTVKRAIKKAVEKVSNSTHDRVWLKLLSGMVMEKALGRMVTYDPGDVVELPHSHARKLLTGGGAVEAFPEEIEEHLRNVKRLAGVTS